MKTIAVILGASEYASSFFESNTAFCCAKDDFFRYITDHRGFSLSDEDICDLFNTKDSPSDIVRAIGDFISSRNSGDADSVANLIYYYVGHGYVAENDQTLYWAVSNTSDDIKTATGINVKSFYECISHYASNLRVFGIIDCCFSASALRGVMADTYIDDAVKATHKKEPLPCGGVLICSSSPDEYSYLDADNSGTVFTKSLIDVLYGFGNHSKAYLSARAVTGLVRTRVKAKYHMRSSTPHIFDVVQEGGLLSEDEFFPIIRDPNKSSAAMNHTSSYYNISWEPSSEDVLLATQLYSAALSLSPALVECVRNSDLSATLYASGVRVKSVENILGKVNRKILVEERDEYRVGDITDILGLRIQVLFFEDLGVICNDLCDLLVGTADIQPNCLYALRIREAKIYTTAGGESAVSPVGRIRKLLARRLDELLPADGEVTIGVREDYSSVHIVADLKPINQDGGVIEAIPVEIQIRTVFEDAWAQIDHKLRYAKTRQRNEGEPRNISVSAERHLVILKSLLDSCSSYADAIREELEPRLNAPSQKMVAIDGGTEFSETAELLQLDAVVIRHFRKLLDEKEAIDARSEANFGKGFTAYSRTEQEAVYEDYAVLAERFSRFVDKQQQPGGVLAIDKIEEEASRYLMFSARMEEAYCRSQSETDDEKLEALRVYEELSETFSESPIVFFRLGQSASKNGEFGKAVSAYDNCLELMESETAILGDGGSWLLNERQKEYIENNIHRVMGYACWAHAEAHWSTDPELATSMIIKAWKKTFDGLAIVDDTKLRRRLENNLLSYYDYMDELEEPYRSTAMKCIPDDEWVARAYRDFANERDVDDEDSLNVLDTLVVVGEKVGARDTVLLAADRILELGTQPEAAKFYGQSVVDVAIRNAWRALPKRT